MNQQHAQHPSEPATLWEAADALNCLRDALVELALALHDLQFELEDDTRRAARERALLWIAKPCGGNTFKSPS